MNEGTAPGTSGLTAAHFKANAKDDELADVDAALANFSYVTGYPPDRWRRCIDLLIRKKIGNDFVEDSCPIVLFEIDCNNNHKIMGWEMMWAAEANGGLAPEQCGSRKAHSAAKQALNKRLLFNSFRQRRAPATDTAVDLQSCYDLIAHTPASIGMQSQHVPQPPIICMFTTLQDMVHTVRTAFGDSLASFGGDLYAVPFNPPPQGVGQGNGAGPAIWAVVSTPVLNMLRSGGHGAHFKLAISGEDVLLVGFAFVDDGDVVQTASSPYIDGDQMLAEGQAGIDCYTGGMRATGGRVRPDKCWCYLIEFKWKDGEWDYVHKDQSITEGTLHIAQPDGSKVPIERLDVSTASEHLGVWLAPDGNNTEAIKVLKEKSAHWADRVWSKHLGGKDAWDSFHSTVLKSVECPLAALTMTEKECKSIEWPMLKQAMSSSGMPASLSGVVRDGPTRYQGFGHQPLYVTQGLKHIELLQAHGTDSTITGNLLRASIQQQKLELGTGSSLFNSDFNRYGNLATDSWCKHTWEFAHSKGISVEESTPNLVLRRVNDAFIAEEFVNSGMGGAQLLRANRCRMCLQATTIADIATGDGKEIMTQALEGRKDEHRPRHCTWPTQGKPSEKDWQAWRAALRKAFVDPERPRSRTLARPLGCWLEVDNEPPWQWHCCAA